MWPWKQKKNNIVSVSLNPLYMTCCYVEQHGGRANIFYEKTDFVALEFEKSLVFSPTKISLSINQFIKKHKIQDPAVAMSVNGPGVFEKMVTLPTSSVKREDFAEKDFGSGEFKNTNFNYTYLCPSLTGGFDFYVCGMKREYLFQYKLLAIMAQTKLASVTTERAALIQLYKDLKGQKFNQGQLALDLSQNNYDMKNFFVPDLVGDIIKTNFAVSKKLNVDLQEEASRLATSLGLFCVGSKTWKI